MISMPLRQTGSNAFPLGLPPDKQVGAALSLILVGSLLLGLAGFPPSAHAAIPSEFTVKRQDVFEFADKAAPAVSRDGDQIKISFTTKAFCDVTIAIEDGGQQGQPGQPGRIVRHLASGVLGPNAPDPFQRNSLKQVVAWDGKDDQGVHIDKKGDLTVRVSLGLKPQFERTLFWSPYKRVGFYYPVITAAAEGVYVAEGYAAEHIRLFDHQGNYLRTVYPFPPDKLDKVVGLTTHTFIQTGQTLPLKGGYHQATLLPCGTSWWNENSEDQGYAVHAMAANKGLMALVNLKLNRMAADGSSGGLKLEGPKTSVKIGLDEYRPLSAALSPDGKWLYLAGYEKSFKNGAGYDGMRPEWLNCVMRLAYAEDAAPALFAGSVALVGREDGPATGDARFKVPSSVACDSKGRVYISDYMNDRIQVLDADGKLLKSLPIAKPARVLIHRKTDDIYVFSWMLVNRLITTDKLVINATMTHLGPLDNPGQPVKAHCPLPLVEHNPTVAWNYRGLGLQHRVELDSWADTPTIWIVNGAGGGVSHNDDGSILGISQAGDNACIRIFEEIDGKLELKRSFADDVKKSVKRLVFPILGRQRLYVNPVSGKLYVGEGDCGVMKAFNQLVEISPDTGKIKLFDLPLGAEDICFDQNGLIYIRTDTLVVRYDPITWREIPWDYGQEYEKHSWGMGAKDANIVSGLVTPGHRTSPFWHQGGIDISPKGHLVVTTCNLVEPAKWRPGEARMKYEGKKYTPPIYPGRLRWGEIHIFDKHGRLIVEDAVPGMGHTNGMKIDQDDNLYMMSASRRLIDGKPFDPTLPNDASCTVLKVPAGKCKVLTANEEAAVALPPESWPKRPQELAALTAGVSGWVDGAAWFYGGVGFGASRGGCICWNCRFDKDYFNRSFAPEPLMYSVAVLDSNGNLITRIGKYGNVDDGKPVVAAGGPSNPRSIGGDEVALFHADYVATHSDRRLFIADHGNGRILSVKLGYHATERVAVPER